MFMPGEEKMKKISVSSISYHLSTNRLSANHLPANLLSTKILIIITIIFLIILVNLTRPQNGYADYPDMDMTATPNPVGSGARAMGMGGAFIGVADDATAASWNPAGLLQLTKPELSMAGSYFSGENSYDTSRVEGDIEDHSPYITHLNYASAVIPFQLFNRNILFSLNYQHLYEFSLDISKTWRETEEGSSIDKRHRDEKRQRGSLCTLSPALAFEPSRFLFLGMTCNFWDNRILDNGWENINIQYAEGMEQRDERVVTKSAIYEKYDFSGFNMNFGFLAKSDLFTLWGKKRQVQIGGVFKTPFKADIRHEKQEKWYEEFPDDPASNRYYDRISHHNFTLKMPLSYGLGVCFKFSDSVAMSLDAYRTQWDQYVFIDSSGKEWSPINKKAKDEANIKATTQIRWGGEYKLMKSKYDVPIRIGAFYDPEPASDRPDTVYGVSCGTGFTYRGASGKDLFSCDLMYQFRLGEKRNAESMDGEAIVSRVRQHYFSTSIICYLF